MKHHVSSRLRGRTVEHDTHVPLVNFSTLLGAGGSDRGPDWLSARILHLERTAETCLA